MAAVDFDALASEIKFDKDPAPTTKSVRPPRKSTATGNSVGRPSKDSAIKSMAEEVEGLLLLAAMPLKMRDIHDYDTMESCADMFMQYDPKKSEIVATPELKAWSMAFAKIGVENKFIRRFFESTEGVSNWLGLAMATQPFIVGFTTKHGVPSLIGRRSAHVGEGSVEGS